MPLQATSGAASYDAFGGGVVAEPNYIESVFSTFLYTGTGATNQTITNGIDLAGKGGLVWVKNRATANHALGEPNTLGFGTYLVSNTTAAAAVDNNTFRTFNSNGFTIGSSSLTGASSQNYVSWTFREQPKFFDVVTYTGTGTQQAISHNLGSAPGCIIVKQTAGASAGLRSWYVYHRSLGATQTIFLNLTNAAQTDSPWGNTEPTSTQFTVNGDNNVNGGTYVAYLFAHNAGGFGLSGTDNVISCGSFTTDGSGNATVDLGYEPQWIMNKASSNTQNWIVTDNMRGMYATAQPQCLFPNTAGAEVTATNLRITSTGFTITGYASSQTSIYIAIRRGPMRTPTTGTSVFTPVALTPSSTQIVTTGFPTDWTVLAQRSRAASGATFSHSRLQGGGEDPDSIVRLFTNNTNAENTSTSGGLSFQNNTGIIDSYYNQIQGFNSSTIYWNFRRAPGYFDVVCYTGTGVAGRTVAHNLTAVPELMIVKGRNQASTNWAVYSSSISNTLTLYLNATLGQSSGASYWNSTTPTSSVFTVGNNSDTNTDTYTYVAYLFATCAGVSKVGSFTGTGATQVINCGFTGGARFVLIKATSTTGDWYVWDSARGIVAGNDPYLTLNTTAAEVTTTDWVDTAATGFELSNAGGNLANSNGVSYIFLAIA